MKYTIHKTEKSPVMAGNWDDAIWSQAETLKIECFHPRSSSHKPGVLARLLYDARNIYVHFKVSDQYVRSVTTLPQGPVCTDSCVEFFFKPRPDRGYLNVEANCGGTFLSSYIEDHRRIPDGFAKYTRIDQKWLSQIRCHHTLPGVVEPEITQPCEWQLEYALPVALIEAYTGPLGALGGQTWQANFFKCGDKTSHPHWGSWAPIGEELNFHKPEKFAPIHFQV
ncbi:MAG: carbohydrate-binding family 9-like protein [bacterium]